MVDGEIFTAVTEIKDFKPRAASWTRRVSKRNISDTSFSTPEQAKRFRLSQEGEKKSDIEFVKPGKTFKIFMNEAKKHNLSDTDLLHVLLFMKIVYNKSYSIEDFPLLIKSDDIIINPLFI